MRIDAHEITMSVHDITMDVNTIKTNVPHEIKINERNNDERTRYNDE